MHLPMEVYVSCVQAQLDASSEGRVEEGPTAGGCAGECINSIFEGPDMLDDLCEQI